jgi:addiction module HigA family antidote
MTRPINGMRPVHPGELLREDFLIPLGLSVNTLAVALNVSVTLLHRIVKERQAVDADTAERLARYFGGDAISWLMLQAVYDLKNLPTQEKIRRDVHPCGFENENPNDDPDLQAVDFLAYRAAMARKGVQAKSLKQMIDESDFSRPRSKEEELWLSNSPVGNEIL